MDILLAGESWHEVTMTAKAQDVTTSSTYIEAGEYLIAALEAAGADVAYQPCHIATKEFPSTHAELDNYDLVILSDIGSQSLLLTPAVASGTPEPNRLQVLADYVADGGAIGMIGGYMSYAGKQGQAGYARTPLADVLPVNISHHDDRIERPAGVIPQNCGIEALPDEWPAVLGYNRFTADKDAHVLATVDEDPLLVVGSHKKGSAFAFATDCAEHWAPKPFLEWDYLPEMWNAVLTRMG